jgi:predicted  nucleic acid-binding Zn-ribbon protein
LCAEHIPRRCRLVQKSNIVDLLTRELNELRSTCASQSDTSTPPTKRRKIAEAESELEALKQAVAKLRNDNTELQREFDRYREEAGSELSKIKAEIVDTAKYVTGLLSSQPPSKDTPWGTGQIKVR